jgi:hypothetical protein
VQLTICVSEWRANPPLFFTVNHVRHPVLVFIVLNDYSKERQPFSNRPYDRRHVLESLQIRCARLTTSSCQTFLLMKTEVRYQPDSIFRIMIRNTTDHCHDPISELSIPCLRRKLIKINRGSARLCPHPSSIPLHTRMPALYKLSTSNQLVANLHLGHR